MAKKFQFFRSNHHFFNKTAVIISIAVISLLLALFLLPDLIKLIEYETYYLRYRWALSSAYLTDTEKAGLKKDLNVCIVDIDERSVSKDKLGYYGNWRRNIHGELVNSLSQHYPGAILFDICFHEPEDENIKKSTSEILDLGLGSFPQNSIPSGMTDSIISRIDFDHQFAVSTQKAGNVIQCFSARNRSDYTELEWNLVKNKTSTNWLDSLNRGGYIRLDVNQFNAFTTSNIKPVVDGIYPQLGQAAMNIGYINAAPNSDGIIRSIPLLFRYGDHNIATLSLGVIAAAQLFGTPDSEIVFNPGKYLDIGKPFKIFKQHDGAIKISYPHFSADELRLLLSKKKDILSLSNGQSITIASYCKVTYDSINGQRYISMNSGDFSIQIIKALQTKQLKTYQSLSTGHQMYLPNGVSFLKESDLDWVISSVSQGEEYYIQESDLQTLLNLDIENIEKETPGNKLLFHNFKVWKDKNGLHTSIPVLSEPVLLDLLNISWQTVLEIPSGHRMEFGAPVKIPLDNENLHTINYIGPRKTFQYYSYYDILKNRISGELDGKIFIIGSSLPNLFDIKAAPHDIFFPGVEIHATLINSFLQNSFITRTDEQRTFLILVSFALLGAVIFSLTSPIIGSILFLFTVLAYLVFSMSIFSASKIWIPVAQPIFTLSYSFIFSIAYRFLVEEKNKKYLYATFSSYLSPAVIENMYRKKLTPTLGGVESEITAFFTDIQGFSSFSEKLGSPTKLVSLLNEYLSAMTDILLRNEGTLDKYEGDAIIAFFGAPRSTPDHFYQACITALQMQHALGELRNKWVKEGDRWPDIVKKMRMRIGINSGQIVTGNMGSNKRMNYTMMGDEVNLAARLESAAKQFGVFTLVGENTYKHVSSQFEFRHLDKIKVVGKEKPVNVYELLCENGKADEQLMSMIKLYAKGYDRYLEQNFRDAISLFEKAKELEPNKGICKITPSERMIKLSQMLIDNPPGKDWDGTTELSSK